jgi:hypothetical protein
LKTKTLLCVGADGRTERWYLVGADGRVSQGCLFNTLLACLYVITKPDSLWETLRVISSVIPIPSKTKPKNADSFPYLSAFLSAIP